MAFQCGINNIDPVATERHLGHREKLTNSRPDRDGHRSQLQQRTTTKRFESAVVACMIGSLATRVRARVCHDDAQDDGDESRRLGVSASGLRGCNAVAPGPLAHLDAPSRQSSSKAAPRQAAACPTTLIRAPEVNRQRRSLMRCHGRAEQLSGPAAIAAARSGPTSSRRRVGGRPEEFAALIAGTIGRRRAWSAPFRRRKSHDDENALSCLAISAKHDAGERA
jgi:hypothetical protein